MDAKRLLISLLLAARLFAGDSAAPPVPTGKAGGQAAGWPMVDRSPADRLPHWLRIGGQIRGRWEMPSGTSLTNSGRDGYYASRLRVTVGVQPVAWLRFGFEAQDARTAGYGLARAPTTLYNPIDIRQAYLSVQHEGPVSFSLRGGRQELAFGAERLIGPADWGMSRTFDALDLTVGKGGFKVDLLAGSAVLIDSTRLDRHRPGEHFYGAYAAWKASAGFNVEPYMLFKQNLAIKSETGVTGDALLASPGMRVFGKVAGRFDYSGEATVQRGSYSADRVEAFGYAGTAGWTVLPDFGKLRASVEYAYASGDSYNRDGMRKTFDQFYPSNHGYYGMIDQFGWKNLKNLRAGLDFQPHRKLKVRADYNDFSLATVQDSLYNSSGSSAALNRAATSGHIGNEVNGVAVYQWSKIWKFGAGLGHLFAGQYLRESKAGFGYTYPYVMVVGTM